MSRFRKHIPLICGALFAATAATAVAAAWTSGVHLFDFGISFSAYIGLSRSVSVLWFCAVTVMMPLLAFFTVKTRMPKLKKAFYAAVLLCIFGTAFFPFNTFSDAPTALTADVHNYFAIGLMLLSTATFFITAFTASRKAQRVVSICSIAYALSFIVLYFTGTAMLFKTFFVWEVMFIILLLLEFHFDDCSDTDGSDAVRK